MQGYIVRQVLEHVEVFDRNGEFLFSADTRDEALKELELV